MPALLDDVRFAFQPLFNLNTGGVVAVEALARPHDGSVQDLLQAAFQAGLLTNADVGLACRAVRAAADFDLLLPLHINLLAITVADKPEVMSPLYGALRDARRSPDSIVIEVGEPYSRANRARLARGLKTLRNNGFRIALDCVGEGDVPLGLLTSAAPDFIKLDREIVRTLPDDAARCALVRSLVHLGEYTGGQVVAEGVETEAQLTFLRKLGVGHAQGNMLAPPQRRPAVNARIAPEAVTETGEIRRNAGPRVTDFLHPATTLPEHATSEEVREVLASQPTVTGVVLVDDEGRPKWSVDRNRFLLAVTGPYGHALHAKREAARLADKPHIIGTESSALDLLDVVAHANRERTNDDLIVVDHNERCMGVVRVADVVRGVAELKVEQAAALSPLTRLPGSDALSKEVERRIEIGEIFAVSWLDVDSFKQVNDTVGFAAGDDLIREIGHDLAELANAFPGVQVGHVGGDDFLILAGLDETVPLSARLLDKPYTAEGRHITLSLATLICAAGSVGSYREVSRLLAPVKEHAKSLAGSSWVMGRPGSERRDVLRGVAQRAVS
ncbi:GGDEF domain-containing protein [Lentzea flava]|uniref:GGDEF domain-containing protein n=1 Tax=Lentzea flava TaxID=103732 RepID=UPI0016702E2A|nr:GGDEF domain-containing protein [Lentzea flava]MCP2204420.1 diguanylate cyclase (GGDEF) domain-containing protein [Lentzea flava]